ncbi:hypothetical protein [Govanella unica]|uniref:Integrase catalytic domain-containing protein n=1 Tax=Govanella unica TaxID=2975056 RepID=A0A9X3Z769_9PROT|nr:hypothetical protein [Govania unica]MDA5193669.1 hypothetical protein [Govania unica]
MAFDNGSEFSRHAQLTSKLGMRTFFCKPHALWQKGGIENAIGRLFRDRQRKSDLAAISDEDLEDYIISLQYDAMTPKKYLGFQAPLETFLNRINQADVALET